MLEVEATDQGHAAGLAELPSVLALATKLLSATGCAARQGVVLPSIAIPSPSDWQGSQAKPARCC